MLLTTQYLEEADQLASRIAVVDGGKVIANDTPQNLKAQLGDTVVELGFADETVAKRALGLLGEGVPGKVEQEGSMLRVSSDQGPHVLVEVLRRFDTDGVETGDPGGSRAEFGRRVPDPHGTARRTDDRRCRTSPRTRRCRVSATSVPTIFDTTRDRRIPMGVVRDTIAIAKRNLIAYRRVPQLLVFSTIQPVIFVVMFRYVFGGAISSSLPTGVDYVDYLMPGIFVQTVVFGAIATAIGLSTDMKSGLMERFHALPMARSAVLTGRTTADATRNVFVVVLMMVVGFLVGWRIHTNFLAMIAAGLIVVLFGFAMSWVFATVGLRSAIRKRRKPPHSRCWRRWCSPRRHSCRRPRCPGGCRRSRTTNRYRRTRTLREP